MIVAKRNPAGAPRPFPKPTAIGVLLVIAVIGAALATAMKRTATMPIAPFFRPAGAGSRSPCVGADSVVIAALPFGSQCKGAATSQFPQ
jgi:hypothetical protein